MASKQASKQTAATTPTNQEEVASILQSIDEPFAGDPHDPDDSLLEPHTLWRTLVTAAGVLSLAGGITMLFFSVVPGMLLIPAGALLLAGRRLAGAKPTEEDEGT